MGLGLAALLAAGSPIPHGEVKSGTAFFVSTKGRLLTSAHFLAGCAHVEVWPPGKSHIQARIVGVDPGLDLGMIEVPSAPEPFAIPKSLQLAVKGEQVSMIAYGVRPDAPRERRLIKGTVMDDGTTLPVPHVVVIRARLQPGTSGAPVINVAGALIGVIIGRYATQPELAVAMSGMELSGFLARNGVTIPPGNGDQAAEPETLLKDISVLVQCVPETSIKPEKSGIMAYAHRAYS